MSESEQTRDENEAVEENVVADKIPEDKIFVARQPIFDIHQKPCAFELLYRDSGSAKEADVSDPDKATLQMIAEGFTLGRGNSSGKPVFISFSEKMLIEGHAEALPADKCVLEIHEDIAPRPDTVGSVKKLKGLGYKIALDDYSGKDQAGPWLPVADIIKIDVQAFGSDPAKLQEVISPLGRYKCRLLAEKVESIENFKMARALGFLLFQGYFFCKPEIIEGRQFSSNEIIRLKILQELGNKDFEVKKISELLRTDASLSYRLFRYINSAGMGLSTPITTLDRAITLLGQRKLVQWLRVLMLYDLSRSKKTEEVVFTSVQRARFLELITSKTKGLADPEAMFLLGMFSLLDVILGAPMERVLEQIPLDSEMKAALTGRKKNHYLIWLAILKTYERQKWHILKNVVGKLGLEMGDLDLCYTNALKWAHKMMGDDGQ